MRSCTRNHEHSSRLPQHLHSRSIVHGDIKTLNAIYVEAGSFFKWCDFGFSKKIKEVQSLASQFASIAPETGTLRWMAPELLSTEVHIVPVSLCISLLSCSQFPFSGGAVVCLRYVLFWRHFVGNFLRPHALRHACQIWDRIECHPAASSQRFAESSSPRPQPC